VADLSSLAITIMGIVGVRAKTQMMYCDAARTIARVHHDLSVWYRPVVQFPLQTVRAIGSIGKLDGSVPTGIDSIKPNLTAALWNPLASLFENVNKGCLTVASAVSVFFLSRSPSTIARLKIAGAVDSVKNHTVRALAHIGKEFVKSLPSVANGYAKSAVVAKLRITGMATRSGHALPIGVSLGSGHPMTTGVIASNGAFNATAGRGVIPTKIRREHDCRVAAVTQTYPTDTRRFLAASLNKSEMSAPFAYAESPHA
jgi:hypothetical protein